jgi:hypothetical protein
MDQEQVKQNILSGRQWIRMLFMAGYILASWVLTIVLLVTILVQTLIVLITGETNDNLRRFGILCGVFMHQIIHFLVYGSDDKPFPFSEFPDIDRVDAGERFGRDGAPKYDYQPGSVRNTPNPASASDYDDIIPSTDTVNADDDFPAAGDSGVNPDRLN